MQQRFYRQLDCENESFEEFDCVKYKIYKPISRGILKCISSSEINVSFNILLIRFVTDWLEKYIVVINLIRRHHFVVYEIDQLNIIPLSVSNRPYTKNNSRNDLINTTKLNSAQRSICLFLYWSSSSQLKGHK